MEVSPVVISVTFCPYAKLAAAYYRTLFRLPDYTILRARELQGGPARLAGSRFVDRSVHL